MKSAMYFIATVGLMTSVAANAENWTYVGQNATGSIYLYDKDTVRRGAGIVYVWIKRDASRDKTKNFYEAISQIAIDCSNETQSMMSFQTRDSTGKTINGFSIPRNQQLFEPIGPDSIDRSLLERVC